MSWRHVVGLVSISAVGGVWGWFVGITAHRLFFHHNLVAYVIMLLVGCMGGGALLGYVHHKLTWPRRRRELLKQAGFTDDQIKAHEQRRQR